MKLKTFKILIAFAFFGQTAMAQVYSLTDGNKPFEYPQENEMAKKLMACVNKVQVEDVINVPDSVVLAIVVNNQKTADTIIIKSAFSNKHAQVLAAFISENVVFKETGRISLAVVFPRFAEEVFAIHQFTAVPETEVCNKVEAENETFRLACFEYINQENLKQIAGPDSAQLLKVEGRAEADIVINKRGRVKEVRFKKSSFNAELNDIIVSQLAELRFLEGGFVGDEQVSYLLAYNKSFMNLENSSERECVALSKEQYQKKAYYPSIFTMLKARNMGYKLKEGDVNRVATAYWLEGDSSSAFNWWRDNFKEEELKGMRMVPYAQGDVYAVNLVAGERRKDVYDAAMPFAEVEMKPVYPGCEDAGNVDAQFECFNKSIMQHIGKTFKYPDSARQRGIQGRMFINFVIEKDGNIKLVNMARGVHPVLDLEGLRVVCLLPKMKPAMHNGKPVRMQYTIPINAKLQ